MESAPEVVHRKVLRLPAERRDGGGDRGGPGAHDGRDLVDVDQLARGAHAGLGVGLVVFRDQLDLAAEHAAGGVDLVDHRLHGLDHDGAIGAARAGQRRQRADLDRGALGEGELRQGGGAGQSGCAQASRLRRSVSSVMVIPSCCWCRRRRYGHQPPRKSRRISGSVASAGPGAFAAVAAGDQHIAARRDFQRFERMLLDHQDRQAALVQRDDGLEQLLGRARATGRRSARRAAAGRARSSAPSPWPGSGAGRPRGCGRAHCASGPASDSGRRAHRRGA